MSNASHVLTPGARPCAETVVDGVIVEPSPPHDCYEEYEELPPLKAARSQDQPKHVIPEPQSTPEPEDQEIEAIYTPGTPELDSQPSSESHGSTQPIAAESHS